MVLPDKCLKHFENTENNNGLLFYRFNPPPHLVQKKTNIASKAQQVCQVTSLQNRPPTTLCTKTGSFHLQLTGCWECRDLQLQVYRNQTLHTNRLSEQYSIYSFRVHQISYNSNKISL